MLYYSLSVILLEKVMPVCSGLSFRNSVLSFVHELSTKANNRKKKRELVNFILNTKLCNTLLILSNYFEEKNPEGIIEKPSGCEQ